MRKDIPSVTESESILIDAKHIVQEILRSEARIDGLKEQVKAEREHLSALNRRLLGAIYDEYPLLDREGEE